MASQSLYSWYDPIISYAAVEFKLAVPLRFERVADVKWRRVVDSIDRTNREILTIGSKVEEVDCVIRYDDDPGGLRDMLEAGADGTNNLSYLPSKSAGGTAIVLQVLIGTDRVTIEPDPDTYVSHGHWTARFRARVVSGTLDTVLV
jgi:hypothetical protein